MMFKNIMIFGWACGLILASQLSVAGEYTIPNTFTAGRTAVANDVNINFSTAKTAIDDNNSRIAVMETALATLQATVNAQAALITVLQNSNVMALAPYITVSSDTRGPLVRFDGVNLQVVNGLDQTDSLNGLGNLIVGYDESFAGAGNFRCSDGRYTDVTTCEANGAIWSNNHKTGSHYLILGKYNNYSQFGGIVAGRSNFANGPYSSVTSGFVNTASGEGSHVSGGTFNTSNGVWSSVSGGSQNASSGQSSSVSGGDDNTASGFSSSVSSGYSNTASGNGSSINGGNGNTASNQASSVSGGNGRSAVNVNGWVAGGVLIEQ